MEFEIAVNNPCNTGNRVVFVDSDKKEVEKIEIMSEWSDAKLDLPLVFTDQFSKEGGLGSCGNLTFELSENSENDVNYTFIYLDKANSQLIVESDDPKDAGTYTVALSVSLAQYPDAATHMEYIKVEILSANAGGGSIVAWILLPIFVIIFFLLGGFLGIVYQRRKDGWNVSPWKDRVKTRSGSPHGDETRFDGVDQAGRISPDLGPNSADQQLS